ncbi:hypothetical protein SLS62_010220 [Diatrype stigma]|uniref:Uncharacterized protein n=1 Tax=Diatrype stigma TaxID=117547 RepID=A0AAN9YJ64_9PEZI
MLLTFWEQLVKKAEGRDINTFGNHSPPELIERELLKLLVSTGRDIYIAIDALDQLPSESQYQLINWLNATAKTFQDETSCRLSIALSSRDCSGVDQLYMHKLFSIEVTTERNRRDIELYLEKGLNKSKLLQKSPMLRKKVFDRLNQEADGMFLWVSLRTLNICELQLETQVLKALESLIPPQRMREMYEAYAEGFESLSELIQRQISQRIMALLAHSAGSMPREVILVALSLDEDGKVDQTLHQELTNAPDIIVRFCSHLVRIDENLRTFQFCHRTVFDFFSAYKPAMYNHRIAGLCLSHLCSADFSQGPLSDVTWWATSIKKSIEDESIESLKKSHRDVLNLLEIIFNKRGEAEETGNLQLAFQVHLFNRRRSMLGGISHEHVVSYFALVELFDIFRERNWFDAEKLDHDGLRPIHWAIRNEIDHDAATLTVKKLIEYGTDVNIKDKEGRIPSYYAAHGGNWKVTKLLVDHGAELNLTDKNGETPLIAACRTHHEKVISCLVKAQADVTIQSLFGTALQAISMVGCCNCAKAILARHGKGKIVEPNGPFGTSLHAAAFHGHLDVVKLLCSTRINVRATHRTYGSPVTAASTGFNPGQDPAPFLEIIEELIKHGVKVNDRSGLVGPALRAAAYHGSPELVKLLLEKGAKVRKAKGPMGTAYEAADERGHQRVKEILLDNDPRAADYGGAPMSKSVDRQQIQRKVFKTAVKASSMENIDSLVSQFEKFFEKETKRGVTPFLRGLAKLGQDSFQDVVTLATKSHDKPNIATRPDNGGRLRVRKMMSHIFCMPFSHTNDELVLESRPTSAPSPHLRRAGTSFVEDSLGEHFPQVLDRMTQAAVKIMEDAIASKDQDVIKLVANTWVEALRNLVSYPGFGEAMLEMVVQRRANELKGHLTNPNLSPEERYERAEALVLVGIELLMAAMERGKKFRPLCLIISKLWVKAVSDVEDLGEEGEAPVRELIRIFAERFTDAVMIQDQVHVEVYAQAAVELLRAAALSSKTTLLEKISNEWVVLWGLAIEKNMGHIVQELLRQRWEEYQTCFKGGKYDEAFGLALASLGVLRAAIERRNNTAISTLQPIIESGLQFAREGPAERKMSCSEIRAILNAVVRLFATAEEVQPGYLDTFAVMILDLVGAVQGEYHQEIMGATTQRIEEAGRVIGPTERERQSMEISRTIVAFTEIALCAEGKYSAVLVALKELSLGPLAEVLPNFMDRDELSRYGKAIQYFRG